MYRSTVFFTLALTGGESSVSRPLPLYPRYPLDMRLGGSQSRSGRRGEETDPQTDRPMDRPTNQPTNQQTNRPADPPTHRPINPQTDRPTNQSLIILLRKILDLGTFRNQLKNSRIGKVFKTLPLIEHNLELKLNRMKKTIKWHGSLQPLKLRHIDCRQKKLAFRILMTSIFIEYIIC
jgi:hypothetical protein